jgi:hypothetical protein
MAINLRQLVESDLEHSIEKEWAVLVTLIDPDGEIYSDLKAQVLNFTQQENPETGEFIIVNKPVIVLRKTSLTRIPIPGEKWIIQYPAGPEEGAETIDSLYSPTRAPEDGTDIGFIRLYPQDTEQEE